jgi:hypothetical protein
MRHAACSAQQDAGDPDVRTYVLSAHAALGTYEAGNHTHDKRAPNARAASPWTTYGFLARWTAGELP